MKKGFVAFLLILFLLEGSVFQLLLPQAWGSTFVVIPQLVVSGIIVISLYLPKRYVLMFAFSFGLLHDIVYGPAWGVTAFTLAAVAYGTYLLANHFPPFVWIVGVAIVVGQCCYTLLVYGWYRLFGFTNMPFLFSFMTHIVPTLVFNAISAYPIFRFIHYVYMKKRNRQVVFDTIIR
ncbi:rod shape-determining protein MreD [Laceyella tengchongensis]|uniref:rod shape-determining protein MreD n=1 Tax=Laceyella tengchongensis TaxID=574699 RepID=UPI0012B8E567